MKMVRKAINVHGCLNSTIDLFDIVKGKLLDEGA